MCVTSYLITYTNIRKKEHQWCFLVTVHSCAWKAVIFCSSSSDTSDLFVIKGHWPLTHHWQIIFFESCPRITWNGTQPSFATMFELEPDLKMGVWNLGFLPLKVGPKTVKACFGWLVYSCLGGFTITLWSRLTYKYRQKQKQTKNKRLGFGSL